MLQDVLVSGNHHPLCGPLVDQLSSNPEKELEFLVTEVVLCFGSVVGWLLHIDFDFAM